MRRDPFRVEERPSYGITQWRNKMHQSHSQPSEALRFVHELLRATNENSTGAAELLEQDAQLWGELKRFLELIPAPADQTPPCKEVDLPTPTEQERLRKGLLENDLKHPFA